MVGTVLKKLKRIVEQLKRVAGTVSKKCWELFKKWWELWHFGAIIGCFTFWKKKDFFNSTDKVKALEFNQSLVMEIIFTSTLFCEIELSKRKNSGVSN